MFGTDRMLRCNSVSQPHRRRYSRLPVIHEGNSVLHSVKYERDPARQPLMYCKAQVLFDAADARPSRIRRLRRKGALAALGAASVLHWVAATPVVSRPASTRLARWRQVWRWRNC